ncbi:phosphatase PAP2 family protein [Clostridium grantii]|uniref:Undecaprenyl-diphosphatase n=1 Tax=Clostridium grantii DSM 8605 TaxID=1121316 RepID=A0A1M5VNJ1_9CLOT|nr:phosphatase PAP2 family protein [Clostridium grantii]SHH76797.1 undecaprenyl-diphosphatase [Clostridium grantii DSM 8605]
MFGIIQNTDLWILEFIQQFLNYPLMDKLMIYITTLGDKGAIWILISIFLLINKNHRKTGIMVMIALVLSTILGEGIIKHIVQRLRPFATYPSFKLIIGKQTMYSFPSGHTATAFAAAAVLSKEFKKYNILFFSIAGLIAFSRLYLFVHYPSDIIVGILLGLFSAWLTYKIFDGTIK